MLKKLSNKKLIVSSDDAQFIFSGLHNVGGYEITPSEFSDFAELESFLDSNTFSALCQDIKGLNKGLLNYKSEEGLKILVSYTNNTIIAISAGEYQPQLYHLYLEGIWETNH